MARIDDKLNDSVDQYPFAWTVVSIMMVAAIIFLLAEALGA